jgi:hypothetical protein
MGDTEMTITEQLNAKYEAGLFAVICTNWKAFSIKNREDIRQAKGGVEFRQGKKWVYAFAYQVKFAKII